jgi:hypothetical protein
MHERRQLPRRLAEETIQVRDINTDQPVGQVVNLTPEGLMLVGYAPVEHNLVFQLELELERPRLGHTRLELGAESLWCCAANERGRYWTGYRIIDISLGTAEVIESLIQDWDIEDERQ